MLQSGLRFSSLWVSATWTWTRDSDTRATCIRAHHHRLKPTATILGKMWEPLLCMELPWYVLSSFNMNEPLFKNRLERKINIKSKGGSLGKFSVLLFVPAPLQKNKKVKESSRREEEAWRKEGRSKQTVKDLRDGLMRLKDKGSQYTIEAHWTWIRCKKRCRSISQIWSRLFPFVFFTLALKVIL